MLKPLFLDINHETLLIGMVMPIVVAMILALVGGAVGYRSLKSSVATVPNNAAFTLRVLGALESSNIALTKVADALSIIQRHDDENRSDHKAMTEALIKLVERTNK